MATVPFLFGKLLLPDLPQPRLHCILSSSPYVPPLCPFSITEKHLSFVCLILPQTNPAVYSHCMVSEKENRLQASMPVSGRFFKKSSFNTGNLHFCGYLAVDVSQQQKNRQKHSRFLSVPSYKLLSKTTSVFLLSSSGLRHRCLSRYLIHALFHIVNQAVNHAPAGRLLHPASICI